MALVTKSWGAMQGVTITLTYDDVPLALAAPDPLYTHRYEVRRARGVNTHPTRTYILRVFGVRGSNTTILTVTMPPGFDQETNVARNRYYILDGPDGMSPPDHEIVPV